MRVKKMRFQKAIEEMPRLHYIIAMRLPRQFSHTSRASS